MTQNRSKRKHGTSACRRCGSNVKNNAITICKSCRNTAGLHAR